MRKFLIPVLTMILIACGGKKTANVPSGVKPGQAKVIAVFTNQDGTKQVDVMLRVIEKNIVFDSVKKVDRITIDTFWGKPTVVQMKDSTGKPVVDTAGRPKMITNYVLVSKDSVNWKIAGIPLDSLLKK